MALFLVAERAHSFSQRPWTNDTGTTYTGTARTHARVWERGSSSQRQLFQNYRVINPKLSGGGAIYSQKCPAQWVTWRPALRGFPPHDQRTWRNGLEWADGCQLGNDDMCEVCPIRASPCDAGAARPASSSQGARCVGLHTRHGAWSAGRCKIDVGMENSSVFTCPDRADRARAWRINVAIKVFAPARNNLR